MNAIIEQIKDSTSSDVSNPAEFQLSIKYFTNEYVDFVVRRIKHFVPKAPLNFIGTRMEYSKTLRYDELELKRQENIRRAATRAKQQVQYSIRQIQADHMLTLHTRENINCRDSFFELFTRFIRLVREKDLINGELISRDVKRDYPFVGVPELQDRGAYHMHLAVVGKQDIPLLRACWYVALGGNISDKGENVLGQIDVTSNQKRWSGEAIEFKTMKLVSYLTKYISKSFEQETTLGLSRYTKSRNITKVKIMKQYLLACWANGQTFVDAIMETISIAEFIGVNDFVQWNRGKDIYVLRGRIS